MHSSVLTHRFFWLLVVFSLVLPVGIYTVLWRRRAISPNVVLFFGCALVLIAGVDVYLLQVLSSAARQSPVLADDTVFTSELTTALYLLPAMFGGIGVNISSHVLIRHLRNAEARFQRRPHRHMKRGPAIDRSISGPRDE